MIDDLWYKNALFYCLNVGTFMGADGDRAGGFEGLMRHIDYLAGLGVTALWLMPFQPSPHRDYGYDTQDYYAVDPRYGMLGDFVEFTQQACAASGLSSTWSSTTPRTSTSGSRRLVAIHSPSTATTTAGRLLRDGRGSEAREVALTIPGAERTPLTNLLSPQHSPPTDGGAILWL